MIKQSLGSWSHLWSLSNVSGCCSTSLFGSRARTHQIRDQSRALEDRNDSNNSLEVYTPNSFIHLFYNSPYMDVVDMHNVIVTPSDSVLLEKTMEASYLVGSFPCQFNFIDLCLTSLFGTSSGNRQPLAISAHSGRLLTAYIHCPHTKKWWEPWNQGFVELTSICHSR